MGKERPLHRLTMNWINKKYGHGIHGLINYRATFERAGIMVFGKFGQGVRRRGACLDLMHADLIRHEHQSFGVPTQTK